MPREDLEEVVRAAADDWLVSLKNVAADAGEAAREIAFNVQNKVSEEIEAWAQGKRAADDMVKLLERYANGLKVALARIARATAREAFWKTLVSGLRLIVGLAVGVPGMVKLNVE